MEPKFDNYDPDQEGEETLQRIDPHWHRPPSTKCRCITCLLGELVQELRQLLKENEEENARMNIQNLRLQSRIQKLTSQRNEANERILVLEAVNAVLT